MESFQIMRYFLFVVTISLGWGLPSAISGEHDSYSAIAALAAKYGRAVSPRERMQVCLSAINANIIHEGCAVETIDRLFGTRYAELVATTKEETNYGEIQFGQSVEVAKQAWVAAKREADHELTTARLVDFPLDWYMRFQYDRAGIVQTYFLSNVSKGFSYIGGKPIDPASQATLEEFARKYKRSSSSEERLDLCISSINKGVISGESPVQNLDALFGTNYAQQLPGKQHQLALVVIDLAKEKSTPTDSAAFRINAGESPEILVTELSKTTGWYMRFEYDCLGRVDSYDITNVRNERSLTPHIILEGLNCR